MKPEYPYQWQEHRVLWRDIAAAILLLTLAAAAVISLAWNSRSDAEAEPALRRGVEADGMAPLPWRPPQTVPSTAPTEPPAPAPQADDPNSDNGDPPRPWWDR